MDTSPEKKFHYKRIKSNVLFWEFLPALIIFNIIVFVIESGFLNLYDCSADALPSITEDDSWKEVHQGICSTNALIKLNSFILLPYMFFVAVMMATPLKAGPVMLIRRMYFDQIDASTSKKQPSLDQTLRFVFLGHQMVPIYFIPIAFSLDGYSLSLHQGMNLAIISAAIYVVLYLAHLLWDKEYIFDERISGLRIVFSKDFTEKLDHRIEKQPFRHNVIFATRKLIIAGAFVSLLLCSVLVFNVLREGKAPLDYDQVLYERGSVAWDDNGYFALEGLNAPENITDSYQYGRSYVAKNAAKFSDYKKFLKLPFEDNIPDFEADYTFSDKEHLLRFNEDGDYWNKEFKQCMLVIPRKWSAEDGKCNNDQVIDHMINKNTALWERFNILPKYQVFEKPNMFIGTRYSGSTLINLARLKAAQLVLLVKDGKGEQAINEWLRFMNFYRLMHSAHVSIVDRAIFTIVSSIHVNSLEALLYYAPEVVRLHGEEIIASLQTGTIGDEFRADTFLADDWRQIEPFFVGNIGVPNHIKRKLYRCFYANKQAASIPTREFPFQTYKLCDESFNFLDKLPQSLFQVQLMEPGNPVTNMIMYLILGGVIKGEEMIANMHYQIVYAHMASSAIKLIQADVTYDDVQAYITAHSNEFNNPITGEPFEWDPEYKVLYYKRVGVPVQEQNIFHSHQSFFVNLQSSSSQTP